MSHVTQVSCIPHTTSSAWAPKAHKQSQLCCLKKSQLCCVKHSRLCCVSTHEQPLVGESLFASTEQPVYRLSSHLLRRGGFSRVCGASPSRRGRVR